MLRYKAADIKLAPYTIIKGQEARWYKEEPTKSPRPGDGMEHFIKRICGGALRKSGEAYAP
jgi:hypothetical protein